MGFAMHRCYRRPPDTTQTLSEFIVMYDDIRAAASPSDALLDFCQSTYEAGAKTGKMGSRKSRAERPRMNSAFWKDLMLFGARRLYPFNRTSAFLRAYPHLQPKSRSSVLARHQRDVVIAEERRHNQIAALAANRFHAHHQRRRLRHVVQLRRDLPLSAVPLDRASLHITLAGRRSRMPW